MAVFPTTPIPRIGSSGTTQFLVINSQFEGNFSQTRRAATRGRKMFTLKFNAVTDAEFATLEAFFDANVGGSFTWTNPRDSVEYTVRFGKDSLPFTYSYSGRINTKIELEEI